MGFPLRQALWGLAVAAWATPLAGQVADPRVLVHAAELYRAGNRVGAREALGRYLAAVPEDGKAWLQLGRFYLADARQWHVDGHQGEAPAAVYLDFAATALDQAGHMLIDSAMVFRTLVELERALVAVEESGWDGARARELWSAEAQVPAFVVELGVNLLNSCPEQGVLVTGQPTEGLAVWSAVLAGRHRTDVLPVDAARYGGDPRYRARMSEAMEVDAAEPLAVALQRVVMRRPVCLSPGADPALAPRGETVTFRLAQVIGPQDLSPTGPLSITEFVKAEQRGGTIWTHEVRETYLAAARRNTLLCTGLLAYTGDRPPAACGR
ncbi:MAG: hypothetical protein ACOY71_03845 [Gemmatimonadota bacterium]